MIRWPAHGERLGLGVGLDLPWGAKAGFGPDGGSAIATPVPRFLARHHDRFAYLFVSWQPKNRSRLRLEDYAPAFDDLFAAVPSYTVRALHHTALNLGAMEPYDIGPIVELTNALIDRYDLAWVNEDLGLWSLRGKPLPYPLPPYLTDDGLAASIRNVAAFQERLHAPLVVEFPGFSEGTSLVVGTMHAYDHFRRVVEATGSPCTLDTGHLLSYQWLRGRRGEALYDELDRLPLAHCHEVHLSGCTISGGRFLDVHHGVLLDEQLTMLDHLLAACPNLRAVTYEDPRFDADGVLIPKAIPNFERLAARVGAWMAA